MSDLVTHWLNSVDWKPTDEESLADGSGLPYSTHHGIWTDPLFGIAMRCYRLSDGREIIHADDFDAFMEKFLGEEEWMSEKLLNWIEEDELQKSSVALQYRDGSRRHNLNWHDVEDVIIKYFSGFDFRIVRDTGRKQR